ncbi:xanthine dioxygenase, partial [Phenoliferia sp. Uapishka_3]
MATTFSISPLNHSAGFGASVEGLDLNQLEGADGVTTSFPQDSALIRSPMADATFEALEKALYIHKILIIRGQEKLVRWTCLVSVLSTEPAPITQTPTKQLELVMRFDPAAKPVHGHGTSKEVLKAFGGKPSLVGANPVPAEPMLRLIGRGSIPVGHHGVTEPLTLKSGSHKGFHKDVLTDEQLDAGETRFQRWHIDAAFYRTHPPKVTALWTHTLPVGPLLTARFDDGSDTTMEVKPGRTAFIDSTQMYESLSEKDKAWVDHSRAEYAPSPYQWIQDAKAMGNGFGMESDDLETPLIDLPSNNPDLVKQYPLVWINPLTGEKALQVHSIIVAELFIRTSADGAETVVDNVSQVRQILYDLQRPFLKPENILISPQGEGGDSDTPQSSTQRDMGPESAIKYTLQEATTQPSPK